MAQGPPPRRSARQPATGRRDYQDGGYRDSAYDNDGYQGTHQSGSQNGAYADEYQDDQYQDGYDAGTAPSGYDVPRQQNADDYGYDEYGEEPPPWAGQSIYPAGPGRRERRPPPARRSDRPSEPGYQDWPDEDQEEDWQQEAWVREDRAPGGRRAATRSRKSRRRLLAAASLIVVAAVVVLGVLGKLPFQHKPVKPSISGLVTTFQPGEFRSVPNACTAVSASTITLYLPGKVAHVAQSQGSTQSQCTWTLDARPNFRVLSVSGQAYAPSLLASGNGSATFNAIDAYTQALQSLRNPPKSSKAPKAQLGSAVGLGRNAFTALQVFHVGGDTTAEITVVVRDRNVVISVTMQGQESGGGFGPVSVATLHAAALAATHDVLTGIH